MFLICIAVGAAGSVFVRQLSTDPRKEVRKQLASQLTEQTKRVGDLTRASTTCGRKSNLNRNPWQAGP